VRSKGDVRVTNVLFPEGNPFAREKGTTVKVPLMTTEKGDRTTFLLYKKKKD